MDSLGDSACYLIFNFKKISHLISRYLHEGKTSHYLSALFRCYFAFSLIYLNTDPGNVIFQDNLHPFVICS